MKKSKTLPFIGMVLLLFTSLFSSPCTAKDGKEEVIRLNIVADNRTDDFAILRNNYWEFIDTILIRQNSSIWDSLWLPDGYYYLSYNGRDAHLFLQAGYHLNVSFNARAFYRSITYKGIGAKNNNYLAQKDRLTETIVPQKRVFSFYAQLEEEVFLTEQDSVHQKYVNLLHQNKKSLSPHFYFLEESSIQISKANNLASFEHYKQIIMHKPNYKVSNSYPNPYKNIDLNNPEFLSLYNYTGRDGIAYLYHHHRASQEFKAHPTSDFYLLYLKQISTAKLHPEIRDKIGFDIAELAFANSSKPKEFYDTYMSFASTSKYREAFKKQFKAKR